MEVDGFIEFNTVNFQILGIPAYFFCAFTGLVLTICVYIVLMSSKKYELSQSMKVLSLALCGMVFGAKMFGFLSGIYRDIGKGESVTLDSLIDTGIVFYGGLFGLLSIYWLCLRSKHSILDQQAINVLAVCIPLFHSIARVGCFLSGCCYGKLYQGILAVNYTTVIENCIDVNLRFPVQLLEAFFEFLIFIYLFSLLQNKNWRTKNILLQYLIIYSSGRFLIEFLRGDFRRGLIHGVSFSQCISVLILIAIIGYYLRKYKVLRKKKEDWNG